MVGILRVKEALGRAMFPELVEAGEETCEVMKREVGCFAAAVNLVFVWAAVGLEEVVWEEEKWIGKEVLAAVLAAVLVSVLAAVPAALALVKSMAVVGLLVVLEVATAIVVGVGCQL